MEEPRAKTDDAGSVAIAAVDRRTTEQYERIEQYVDVRFLAAEIALTAAKDALDARLRAGDEQLLIHIAAQKESVDSALAALNLLLKERDSRVEEKFTSTQLAVNKAEQANERRFQSVNEFRAQAADRDAQRVDVKVHKAEVDRLTALIDRNREDISEQRGIYLPTSTFESSLTDFTIWRNKVDVRDAENEHNVINRTTLDDLLKPVIEKVDAMQRWQFKIIGAVGVLGVFVPLITGLLVYYLTRTAIPIDGLR